jgi:hypothetical protein
MHTGAGFTTERLQKYFQGEQYWGEAASDSCGCRALTRCYRHARRMLRLDKAAVLSELSVRVH